MSGAATFSRILEAEQDEDSLKARSIRGGAFAMMTEGADFVLRFGSIMILARLLIPEYFGLIAMVSGFTAIAERFKDLGLSIATVQRKEISHEQVSTLFWVNAAAGAAIMLVIAALSVPLGWFYGDTRVIPITLAISSSFLFSGLAVQHHALLRRQMKYAQMGVVQVGSTVVSIIVAVVLALSEFQYWALVARELTRNVLMTFGAWIFCPWVPALPSRQAGVDSMLRFGGNLTVTNLVYYISFTLDQILVGKYFGAALLGIYRQGFQLVLSPINNLTHPLICVGESALCRLQDDPERFRRFYRKLLSGMSFMTVPFLLFLALYAKELVLIALGPNWIEVAPIFRIMAIACVLRPVATTFGPVMIACNMSRRVLWMGLVTSATQVIFVVASIPFGIEAIALAHVWTMYLLLIPKLYWALKGTPATPGLFFRAIGKAMIAGLVMITLLYFIRRAVPIEGVFPSVAFGSIVGLAIYIGIWLILPGGRMELAELAADVINHSPLSRFFRRRGVSR